MSNDHTLPPPSVISFAKPTREAITYLVRSPLDWWHSHWDQTEQRTRQCAGPNCALCAEGQPPTLRFILRVDDPKGAPKLLELRERHRPLLELMNEHPQGQVGALISIRKSGFNRNAKVEAEYQGHKATTPISVAKLVLTLGLPPVLSP